MLKPITHEEIEKASQLYDLAEKCTHTALKARHSKSGLQFLEQLQKSARADQLTRNRTELAERIHAEELSLEELQTQFDELAELRDYAKAQSERIRLTDEERTAFLQVIAEYEPQCDKLLHQIRNLNRNITAMYDELEKTSSDRADIVHDAIIQALINESEPLDLSKYESKYPDLDDDELQNIANFNSVTNASGRAITNLASPDALNSHVTQVTKATPEEVATWLFNHGGQYGKGYHVPVAVRRSRLSDCYITLEERHTAKYNGWYFVKHYITTAPYQYIDRNENGESDVDYYKTYNPFISKQADIEEIERIATTCNFTHREEILLHAYANGCRYYADFHSCLEYAFSVLYRKTGEKFSDANKRKVWSRLTRKLKAHYNAPKEHTLKDKPSKKYNTKPRRTATPTPTPTAPSKPRTGKRGTAEELPTIIWTTPTAEEYGRTAEPLHHEPAPRWEEEKRHREPEPDRPRDKVEQMDKILSRPIRPQAEPPQGKPSKYKAPRIGHAPEELAPVTREKGATYIINEPYMSIK